MITITKGDTAPLSLSAKTNGAAYDLTGASFSTQIKCSDGSIHTIPNAQHSIVSAAAGTFTLQLLAADFAAIGTGGPHDILTTVTQGANVTNFRARAMLTILPSTPEN